MQQPDPGTGRGHQGAEGRRLEALLDHIDQHRRQQHGGHDLSLL